MRARALAGVLGVTIEAAASAQDAAPSARLAPLPEAVPRLRGSAGAARRARAAWRSYEWGHHAQLAHAAGMGDAEIARVAEQGDAALAPRESLLLRAADELHATQRFSDATWAALRSSYSDAQLVEIPFLVGQYTMLSMVAEGLGAPVEDGLPALPPLAAPPSR